MNETKRVLLVEDDPLISIGVTGALEAMGYDVCATVQDGEGAIAKAFELSPDVILMDINLKGRMTGVEAAQIINAKSLLPIIYLSAQTNDATARQAKLTRHFGYLTKPFDFDELSSTIDSALETRRIDCPSIRTVSMPMR